MYCVVVGDIVNSRNLDQETREQVSRAAKDAFARINTEYISSLMTTFGMVRGDSFEGVLLTQAHAPKIILDIIKAIYRVNGTTVRVSAVMGQLTVTGNDRNDTDGPAFHKAIDDLAMMKERKSTHWLQVSFDTNSLAQPLVDSQLNLLAALTEDWTDKQRKIVWAAEAHGGQQKAIGKLLGISPSVVSKQLKAARYDLYRRAWEALTAYLVNMDEFFRKDRSVVEESYVPYYNMARRKYGQRNFQDALVLLQRSLALAKSDLSQDDPLLIPIYNMLAEVYNYIGQYADAETMLQEAIRLQETLPKARIQYADTLATKAQLYYIRGNFHEAKKYADEALSVACDVLDNGHPYFGKLYNLLAMTYEGLNQPENALPFYEKALQLSRDSTDQNRF